MAKIIDQQKTKIMRLIQGEIANKNKVWWVLGAENITIAKIVVWKNNKKFFHVFPDAINKETEEEQYEFEITNIFSGDNELMAYWHTPEEVLNHYLLKKNQVNANQTKNYSLWEKAKTPLFYGSTTLVVILIAWLSWLWIRKPRNKKKHK